MGGKTTPPFGGKTTPYPGYSSWTLREQLWVRGVRAVGGLVGGVGLFVLGPLRENVHKDGISVRFGGFENLGQKHKRGRSSSHFPPSPAESSPSAQGAATPLRTRLNAEIGHQKSAERLTPLLQLTLHPHAAILSRRRPSGNHRRIAASSSGRSHGSDSTGSPGAPALAGDGA